LVDSRRMRIDTFYREENGLWHIRSYYRKDQKVEIMTMGIAVSMAVIYDDIELEVTEDSIL